MEEATEHFTEEIKQYAADLIASNKREYVNGSSGIEDRVYIKNELKIRSKIKKVPVTITKCTKLS
jgi:hypothetical protein